MRGDPDYIDVSCRERERAAASKFSAERESIRAESEADVLTCDEVRGFTAGLVIGGQEERKRILDGLAHLEKETATLWQDGSAVTRAVAAYTAEVRKCVEGGA